MVGVNRERRKPERDSEGKGGLVPVTKSEISFGVVPVAI